MENIKKYAKHLTLFDKLAIVASPKEFTILTLNSINGRKYVKLYFSNDPINKHDKDFSIVLQSNELKQLINSNKI